MCLTPSAAESYNRAAPALMVLPCRARNTSLHRGRHVAGGLAL